MKYLVIWEQDYDISWVNDIIEEDALDDYIEYYKNQFEEREMKSNRIRKVIDMKKMWYDNSQSGEVNYVVDYGDHTSWSLGFNYSLKEVLTKEELKK